jgi:ABC-type branched-subunit amino acid transport system substrate-binding protein
MRNIALTALALAATGLTVMAGGALQAAGPANDPGVTATTVKIGQTLAYSGPASTFATIGRLQGAYYKMINEQGGIAGRKIVYLSLDDGYSPPKTVEQTRRLVEDDHVFGMFGSLGTPTNASVQKYLNHHKVPQMFLFTGTSRFRSTTRGRSAAISASRARRSISLISSNKRGRTQRSPCSTRTTTTARTTSTR